MARPRPLPRACISIRIKGLACCGFECKGPLALGCEGLVGSDLARDGEVSCCKGLADEIRFVNVIAMGYKIKY